MLAGENHNQATSEMLLVFIGFGRQYESQGWNQLLEAYFRGPVGEALDLGNSSS